MVYYLKKEGKSMLKRLKKSLSLTLVLALCMSFIACGSDGKSDDNFSDDSDWSYVKI